MRTVNIICPFDKATRQTILPLDKDDQPVKLDWWHLTPEKEGSVICRVRGEDAIIDAMISDTDNYCWLEDVEVPSADIKG